MKYLSIIFLLVACNTIPEYKPANNKEYIQQMEARSDQNIKTHTLQVYTYVGVSLFITGVAMIAFTSKLRSGVIMMLGGGIAMCSPFIFDSKWFDWVFGVSISFVLIDLLWFIFKMTKEVIANKTSSDNKSNS